MAHHCEVLRRDICSSALPQGAQYIYGWAGEPAMRWVCWRSRFTHPEGGRL